MMKKIAALLTWTLCLIVCATALAATNVKTIAIKGVTMLRSGATSTLSVSVSPSNATNKAVSWKTSDKSVLTVNSKGLLTAQSVTQRKTVTITATAKDGSGKTDTHSVRVYPAVKSVSVAVIENDKVKKTLTSGKTLMVNFTKQKKVQLKGVTNPTAALQGFTWKSSATAVAAVDTKGLVTIKKIGKAVITVTSKDGTGKYAKITINAVNPVTKITVSGKQSLRGGRTSTMTASVLPANATNKAVSWSSSDKTVATVDSRGVVTTLKVQQRSTVTITATAKDGSGVKGSIVLTVSPSVSSIVLSRDGQTVTGKTLTIDLSSDSKTIALTGKARPSKARQVFTWSSSNAKVAAVSSSGVVTGKAAGTAIITATATDGSGKNAKVTISVIKKITKITLKGAITATSGTAQKIYAYLTPADATKPALKWTTSNAAVAAVSSTGVVTPKTVAKATAVVITATATDGSGVSAQKKITVYPRPTGMNLYYSGKKVTNGTLGLLVGDRPQMVCKVFPTTAYQKVTWSTSNSAVCAVDTAGNLRALKAGTAYINAKAASGMICKMTVKVYAKASITLTVPKTTIKPAETMQLKVSVAPNSIAYDNTLVWSSSDKGVATVSGSGLVKGVEAGVVTITASYLNADGQKVLSKSTKLTVTGGGKYRALVVVESMEIYGEDDSGNYYEGIIQHSSDLSGMRNMFAKQRFNGAGVSVTSLHNTTPGAVVNAIGNIASVATAADVTYVFILCHGADDGTLLFGTNCSMSLSPYQLKRALDKVPGRVVVMLGSCYSGNYIKAAGASPASFNSAIIRTFGRGEKVDVPLVDTAGNLVKVASGELLQSKYYVLTCAAANEAGWFMYSFTNVNGEAIVNEAASYDFFSRGVYRAGGWDQITGSNLWSSGTRTLAQVYSTVAAYCNNANNGGYNSNVQVYPSGSNMLIFSR